MDEFQLRKLSHVFDEDEYGYVETKQKSISKTLIAQLPSRNIGDLINEEKLHDSQKRDSNFHSIRLKSAVINAHALKVNADKVYELLNADDNEKNKTKICNLREMHQSLTLKRQIKANLEASEKQKETGQYLNSWMKFKLQISMICQNIAYELKGLTYTLELWPSTIKKIQGHYGSSVASYFILLRWLLLLNLCNFLFNLIFVIIPQVIYEKHLFMPNNFTSLKNISSSSFNFFDLIAGTGWLTETLLYFGHYTEKTLEIIPGMYYNFPLAYLFIIGVNAIINLFTITYCLTSSYEKNSIDASGEIKNVFAEKVFCAWDYTIETNDAACLRRRAFCTEMQELLAAKLKAHIEKTFSEKIIQYSFIIFVNLFILSGITGIGYLIFYLLAKRSLEVDVLILKDMTLSLTLTFISVTFYFLLKYATKFEYYFTKKVQFYLILIRVVALRTTMLGIIVYFWMIVYVPPRGANVCYETDLAQDIYCLIVLNFLTGLVFITFIGEFLKMLVKRFLFPSISLANFDIAYNTLDLIYYQFLLWIGSFMSPLLPLVMVLILIFQFYLKLCSIKMLCRPPQDFWSANEVHIIFLALIFMKFLMASFSVGYILFYIETSQCGPFKHVTSTGDILRNAFFPSGEEYKASEFLKYASSPGVMFSLFCALCVAVYFMRARALAHIAIVKMTREHLIIEGKDKVFLLKLYDEAIKEHIRTKKLTKLESDVVHNEAFGENYDIFKPSSTRLKFFQEEIPTRTPHQAGFRYLLKDHLNPKKDFK